MPVLSRGGQELSDRIVEALNYCAREFDVSIAEAVGCIEVIKIELLLAGQGEIESEEVEGEDLGDDGAV